MRKDIGPQQPGQTPSVACDEAIGYFISNQAAVVETALKQLDRTPIQNMPHDMVLKEFLPYLLNRAGVKIGLSFSRDIAPYKITLQIWRVLAVLWEAGDQRLLELSQLASIDFSTLSRLLVNMERRRLIARRRSGSDARALSVSLTAQGRELTKKIIPIALYYEKVAIAGLSRAEVKKLKRLLDKLYINIEAFDRQSDESKINGSSSSNRANIPIADVRHLSWRKDKSPRRRQLTA